MKVLTSVAAFLLFFTVALTVKNSPVTAGTLEDTVHGESRMRGEEPFSERRDRDEDDPAVWSGEDGDLGDATAREIENLLQETEEDDFRHPEFSEDDL